MVTTLQDEDRPEPWLKKKKPAAPTRRETTTSAKANVRKEKDVESVPSNLPNESGRGRGRKGKSKVADTDKGPKNRQCLPSATADVVLGRAQNTVPSVEELRRKIDEDAQACGRITRTVRHLATRKLCPTTCATIAGSVRQNDHNSPPVSSAVPSGTPTTSVFAISEGM